MLPEVAPIPAQRVSDGETMQITIIPTIEEPKKRKLKRTEPVEVK